MPISSEAMPNIWETTMQTAAYSANNDFIWLQSIHARINTNNYANDFVKYFRYFATHIVNKVVVSFTHCITNRCYPIRKKKMLWIRYQFLLDSSVIVRSQWIRPNSKWRVCITSLLRSKDDEKNKHTSNLFVVELNSTVKYKPCAFLLNIIRALLKKIFLEKIHNLCGSFTSLRLLSHSLAMPNNKKVCLRTTMFVPKEWTNYVQ